MKFLTNRYKTKGEAPVNVGDNAKRLFDLINSLDWKKFLKRVLIGYGVLIGLIFLTIIVIRLAFKLF